MAETYLVREIIPGHCVQVVWTPGLDCPDLVKLADIYQRAAELLVEHDAPASLVAASMALASWLRCILYLTGATDVQPSPTAQYGFWAVLAARPNSALDTEGLLWHCLGVECDDQPGLSAQATALNDAWHRVVTAGIKPVGAMPENGAD